MESSRIKGIQHVRKSRTNREDNIQRSKPKKIANTIDLMVVWSTLWRVNFISQT